MEKKTKKRLLTGLIITAVVLAILAGGAYFAVNFVFSKVSDTVGETISTETVNLPVVDENGAILEGQSITITLDVETIKKLEEKIPISEKLKVLALLAQHLTSEDYSMLLSYATGDVNNDEVKAAYELMREKLGPEEKEILRNYYAKYMYLLEEENN